MTAEIAILNKTAVALAADSAITISAGVDQHKIFDSADKLFELTQGDPIAIMINSDMNFMEAPLPVIIKQYREDAPRFARVRDAGEHFLHYLDAFAKQSPERVKLEALERGLIPVFQLISKRARDAWLGEIIDPDTQTFKEEYADGAGITAVANEKIDIELDLLEDVVEGLPDASFIGEGPVTLTAGERSIFERLAEDELAPANQQQRDRAVQIMQTALLKQGLAGSVTGVVVAGFGSEELFPTLVSYELQGVIGERLKFTETNLIDIDREGVKARVLPFAQREMVERFLYGLDTPLRERISQFCRSAIPKIADELLATLDLSDADRQSLNDRAEAAEHGFLEGLETEGFQAIQQSSATEIQDMVEFMPKPEMARMAEALVNLTSIKRRVSRGFETVGGPIDVAIISKAEGFVWVKRKHYFPPELNKRYFDRIGDRP